MKLKWFVLVFLMLVFLRSLSAQQIQTIPISPVSQPQSAQSAIPVPQQQILPQQTPELSTTLPPTTPQEATPTTQPPFKEELSEFEQNILKRKASLTVSTKIEQFGYEFFRQSPSTFAPVEKVPVGPDYVIGPGDEIRVAIWGKIEMQWNVVVDRDGNISLPKIGVIGVTGLTFKELREFLHRELSKYYTGFEMNVSMAGLRTIKVYVVGNVKGPGSYTVSALSTLINALFESGGPNKIGTMRDIQLKRNGKVIVCFDMYDFLLKGDKTKDIRLMPEDVIFVPVVGPLVGVAGNIKKPAIYELKKETRLFELMKMAGGISVTGYLQRIQVERVFENQAKVILDLDLKKLPEKENIPLRDGDIVKVFSIIQEVTNPIELKGNFLRPGTYEWKEGIRIKDIIKTPESLLPDTLLEFALIERLLPPDYHKEYLFINLEKLLFEEDEGENIPLMPYDTIVIFNRWDFVGKEKIRITGAVNKPGEYEFRPNVKLSDLVKLAGGLKRPEHPESYLSQGMIIRHMPPDFHKETITFNFKEAVIEQKKEADFELKPFDEVKIFNIWELAQEKKVSITGAVNNPGVFPLTQNMHISDLFKLAEGTKYFAFLDEAELTRVAPTSEGPKTEKIKVNLKKAIEGDSQADILLKEDDYLFVRTVPEWELYRMVTIKGEVKFPGTYTIKKGEVISSLINRAGGYTDKAYLKGAAFSRERVRKLQQEQLNEMVERLEKELLGKAVTGVAAALSPEEMQVEAQGTQQKRDFIATLKNTKAKGRIVIKLDEVKSLKKSPYDLELEEGDTLFVPANPQSIQIIGAVYNQTAFVYAKGRSCSQYINLAGGYTENADKKRVYLLKIDGTAQRKFDRHDIEPGDTIVVTEKLERTAWMRDIKNITQILYQIAVTAGVLIVAF
ncbi:SLBB domain-containing protein [bacterium]|nr:SLBB domain-containing protein [bacterium]